MLSSKQQLMEPQHTMRGRLPGHPIHLVIVGNQAPNVILHRLNEVQRHHPDHLITVVQLYARHGWHVNVLNLRPHQVHVEWLGHNQSHLPLKDRILGRGAIHILETLSNHNRRIRNRVP